MSLGEYREWERAFQANTVESLDGAYDQYSIWFASDDQSPEDMLNDKDLKELLKVSLQQLSGNEALVIQLYYVEELNVYEIAEVLEVTTGRVSQIKKSAISNLRTLLAQVTGNNSLADVSEMFSKGV